MKESQDNTSYTNYKKDGPHLKVVKQAQAEMYAEPQKPNRGMPRQMERPPVNIRPPKPGKGYNT